MSQNSNIEWTDATWNPVEGCSMAKGSETGGCLNCYAARTALRRPAAGLAVMRDSGPRWTGKVQLVERRLDAPLHWRKPRRVFVNSMSDLFHEELPDDAIDRVFAGLALCPRHTFQVLTKREVRMRAYTSGDVARRIQKLFQCNITTEKLARQAERSFTRSLGDPVPWPLPNVWLGVSVENQATADARIPLLLKTPAAVRFVSYEPALGPVDFKSIPQCMDDNDPTHLIGRDGRDCLEDLRLIRHGAPGIDWLIAGYESGPGARPAEESWIRSAKNQCVEAGVAFFYKQAAIRGRKIPTPELDGQRWMQFPGVAR